eukprot:3197024-Amphidinium_carterae.1
MEKTGKTGTTKNLQCDHFCSDCMEKGAPPILALAQSTFWPVMKCSSTDMPVSEAIFIISAFLHTPHEQEQNKAFGQRASHELSL